MPSSQSPFVRRLTLAFVAAALSTGSALAAGQQHGAEQQHGAGGARVDHHGNHLTETGDYVYTNPLIFETSPYLAQHAHNPVEWLPWGDDAFLKAKQENKPIFLSIGYSTCHWCHVMARESFSDPDVAAVLNQHFVSVKVDREERPDVDDVYMTAVQQLRGRGGWPLSAWLTPDLEPFEGGTYYRKAQFLELLESIHYRWQSQQDRVRLDARSLTMRIRRSLETTRRAGALGDEMLELAVRRLAGGFDEVHGGWRVPKFPRENELLYLLDRWQRDMNPDAMRMALKSLDAMQAGGIHDQIGGGFARYAVDAQWLVPHFEKMLYNQAWLGRCYLHAYEVTRDEDYRRTAEGIFRYVLRDMTSPAGAFYSAEDADSEGEEGLFYIWRPAEVDAVLGAEDGKLARKFFGVTPRGNFHEQPGTNILTMRAKPAEFAAANGLSEKAFLKKLDAWKQALVEARGKRIRPERDDKVMADWNGMMIGTFALGHRILGDPKLLDAGKRAADFVLANLRDGEGRLMHTWRGGTAKIAAFQDDYACLIDAMVELFDASEEKRWLDEAERLHAEMREQFFHEDGVYTRTGPRHQRLISASKKAYDGARPSGNSLAAWSGVKLWRRTGEHEYVENSERVMRTLASNIGRANGAAFLLRAFDAWRWGERGLMERSNSGVVRTSMTAPDPHVQPGATIAVELTLEMADGWHVNAQGDLPRGFRPTVLRVEPPLSAGTVVFPKAKMARLEFVDQPVPLLSGTSKIDVELKVPEDVEPGPMMAWLQVECQPCNDERCLDPTLMRLELPLIVKKPPTVTRQGGL